MKAQEFELEAMGMQAIEDLRARAERELQPDVLDHARRTAAIARELAACHGVDPDRAELAGLLHDIADSYSEHELLTEAARYGITLNLTEARVPKLIHGKVGAELLRSQWGITDEELLDAVRYHLSGSPMMGTLAKITFVADKIEPERDKFYGGLEALRELAKTDLDQAILKLYSWRMNQLVTSGATVHEDLSQARNALIDRMQATWGSG